MTETLIRSRDRDAIIQALKAGVVPNAGLRHIQVGRAAEIQALVRDIDRLADGGSSVRFIIGEYGSGKTFFLNLVRQIALERKLVSIQADLAPDRRLYAPGGHARALYAETVRNLATRGKPDGAALANVVERFVTDASQRAVVEKRPVEQVIEESLAQTRDLAGGYDYAVVLKAYWRGSEDQNDELKTAALRWLRGEFSTKTEARQALGVRTIIDDDTVYDAWKLLAAFVRVAGYGGLIVILDEMVNLYKLQNAQSRNQNFEQILRIFNDVLQGQIPGLGVLFGGTPEFLLDTRRGLYSYAALQSRLAENSFARDGLVDFAGPVLRLSNLTPEDVMILLSNLRRVFAAGDARKEIVPDEALTAFMTHCNQRVGEAYFRTPRNTIRAFVQMLSVLEQNPGTSWQDLIGAVDVPKDVGANEDAADDKAERLAGADELVSFKI